MDALRIERDRVESAPVRASRLWAGVLLAPAAWLVAELAGYYLAARSCEPVTGGVPMPGTVAPRVVQAVLAGVLALVAVAGLVLAIGNRRALEPHASASTGGTVRGRAHFMAMAGVIASALFLLGIVLFGLPPFFVNACSQVR